jgi:predicted RNA-binding Zn-ribbon protein involved in translation (DUF1610 family)
MASKRLSTETRIGWMESARLDAGEYHCPECEAIFWYLNDTDDRLPPTYCPECGRRNAKAIDTPPV